MIPRELAVLDDDWARLARMQEILVTNEARIARLNRKLEEMATLLEERAEADADDAEEPLRAEGSGL